MTAAILPVRRNLQFHLPQNRISNWNGRGTHWTHFLNTLSIFFPAGERFFIQSIRNYRDQITDGDLKKAVAAFIGQEAFHTREHEEYNEAMVAAGLQTDKMEKTVEELLAFLQKNLPKSFQLAATVALEHLTAMLAEMVLTDDRFFEGSEERYHALWQWHAMEETEHKGVAYDVYEQAVGKGPKAYAIRTFAFLVANVIFWSLFYRYYYKVLKAEKQHLNIKGWMKSLNFQFGRDGLLPRMLPEWLDFFRPSFHPWDKDNSFHLKRAEELMKKVDTFAEQMGLAAA
ncbi:MAG: metal-dependent hydrolase [Gammaproteobacteria bacterium]|nr:metal-dependent hydrolase [Gammaproteobacteria bacterium]